METRNCRLLGHLDIPGGGQVVVQGGYVYPVDERGLVYLIDRHAGLDILEFSGGWN